MESPIRRTLGSFGSGVYSQPSSGNARGRGCWACVSPHASSNRMMHETRLIESPSFLYQEKRVLGRQRQHLSDPLSAIALRILARRTAQSPELLRSCDSPHVECESVLRRIGDHDAALERSIHRVGIRVTVQTRNEEWLVALDREFQ